MEKTPLIRKSKYLTKLLRHDPENLKMNRYGYVSIKEILTKLDITLIELEEIISNDNKQRFSYDITGYFVKANQGHSISIDLQLDELTPPTILYHGTATKFLASIYEQGLVKGNRQYVHLSDNLETATQVGSRHGNVYVLIIDTKSMCEDGLKFYKSENGVWLTDFVPRKYITN